MKQEEKTTKEVAMKKKNGKKWKIESSLIVLVALIFVCIILLLFQQKVGSVSLSVSRDITEYENYYVIITDETSSTLWDSIYEGAVEAGVEIADAYVEFIEVSNTLEYSLQEKMRIAIDSGVDGIIISADGTEETTALIDEATEKGIPVVTVLNDDSTSFRQCYIGVNNYSLGETYGAVIWEYLSQEIEEPKDYNIAILMDASTSDTGKNTTYLGLKEYLDGVVEENGWEYEITIEAVSMNREEAFVSDETISNIIVNGTADIMICMNAEDTESAYQSIVDYNEVGNVEIIGYYESELILEAIEKDIIKATVTINGEDVGYQCVAILNEYQRTGYVNGYIPVTIEVIDSDNVSASLAVYEEVGADEDE